MSSLKNLEESIEPGSDESKAEDDYDFSYMKRLAHSLDTPEQKQHRLACFKKSYKKFVELFPMEASNIDFETETWLQWVPKSIFAIRAAEKKITGTWDSAEPECEFEVAYWRFDGIEWDLYKSPVRRSILVGTILTPYIHPRILDNFLLIKKMGFYPIRPLWRREIFDAAVFTHIGYLGSKWSLKDNQGNQVWVNEKFFARTGPGFGIIPEELKEKAKELATTKGEMEALTLKAAAVTAAVEKDDKKTKYFRFVPGAKPRTRSSTFNNTKEDGAIFSSIEIVYQQPQGSHTCMVCAMASAMHQMGLHREAEWIHTLGTQLAIDISLKSRLHNLINSVLNGKYQLQKDTFHTGYFDPLTERAQYPLPVWAALKPPPGNSWVHCVVFYDGLVFDPAETHALPITKDSLDYVCGGPGNYQGLYWTKRLIAVHSKKRAHHRMEPTKVKKRNKKLKNKNKKLKFQNRDMGTTDLV